MSKEELMEKIKVEIIEQLNLEDVSVEDIGNEDPLFGEGLGLDSIDALELIVLVNENYELQIPDPEEGVKIFQSVRTMAEFILENKD